MILSRCSMQLITGCALFAALPPQLPLKFTLLSVPSFTSSPTRHASFQTLAKRKSTLLPNLSQDEKQEQVLDEDFRNSINELSTEAVKAMLSEKMERMENLQEKLFELEIYFEKENEKDALLFVLVIRDMLDHKISAEAKNLKGIYLRAFQKICNMVEDSGWKLKGSSEGSELGMIDDDLIPPTLMKEYR
ncbi:hypothetical protein KP509_29G024400 [Ceratopteris richardii]|uniref:Uncharacterized protein n=1 Tax=Ceratopteris richardii TaxID=49495 RepID=A0A8T2R748_CERRI|nr:hypothetical protein KP509_29G024400 [Ceratopteris richardii]